jgi:hypothetical protein
VADDVLDLHRRVECEGRKGAVNRAGDVEGVSRPIEEVGIGEADMACAGRHDLGDIVEHGVDIDSPRPAAVDGGDRAVPASVVTAATGFHARRHDFTVSEPEARIAGERGQVPAQWAARRTDRVRPTELDADGPSRLARSAATSDVVVRLRPRTE